MGHLPEDRNFIALEIPFLLKDRGIFIAVVIASVHLKDIKIQNNRKNGMGELWTLCSCYTIVFNPLNHGLNHILHHFGGKCYINSDTKSNQRRYYVVASNFKAIYIGIS